MKEIPFCANLADTLFPFIMVEKGKFKGMCFLIDTGTTKSLLYDFVAERFCDDIKALDDGKKEDVAEELTRYSTEKLVFGGKAIDVDFLITQNRSFSDAIYETFGFQVHGIIGTDVMIENRWIIDFIQQRIIVPELNDLLLHCVIFESKKKFPKPIEQIVKI